MTFLFHFLLVLPPCEHMWSFLLALPLQEEADPLVFTPQICTIVQVENVFLPGPAT